MPDQDLEGRKRLRRIVTATTVSSVGDGFAIVTFSLLAVKLTTHALLIAGVAFSSRLPWLLLAVPAGALVDQMDRRRLVTTVELVRAAVLALVAVAVLTHHAGLGDIYAGAFLIGTGETMVSAAMRATVPLIVPEEEIPGANGNLNAARTFGVTFAGPALGGLAYAVAASLPLFGDAVSYLFSAGMLRRGIPVAVTTSRSTLRRVLADSAAGLRWFLASPPLRLLALVVSSFAFFQAMVLGILVIYATHDLGLGKVGYGLFLSAAAVGDVGASLLARRIHARLGAYITILVAGIGAGVGYLLLGSSTNVALATIALILEAAATSLGNVATLSLRTRVIPAERFGVVSNAFRTCIAGLAPIGALVGGALTGTIGVKSTYATAGGVQLAVLALMAFPLRSVVFGKGRTSRDRMETIVTPPS